MKKLFLVLITAAMTVSATIHADKKADFSGRWMMDPSKSEGLPPGMDQIMMVSQAGDKLTVQTKIYPDNTPMVIRDDAYQLDGKPAPLSQMMGNGEEARGTRTSRWTEDGRGMEVSDELNFQSPGGPASIKRTAKWEIAPDGKTLSIELAQTTPQGTTRSRRLFVKQ